MFFNNFDSKKENDQFVAKFQEAETKIEWKIFFLLFWNMTEAENDKESTLLEQESKACHNN